MWYKKRYRYPTRSEGCFSSSAAATELVKRRLQDTINQLRLVLNLFFCNCPRLQLELFADGVVAICLNPSGTGWRLGVSAGAGIIFGEAGSLCGEAEELGVLGQVVKNPVRLPHGHRTSKQPPG